MVNKKEIILQKCKNAIDYGEPITDYGFYYEVIALLKEQNNCENCAIAIEDRQPIVRCKYCKYLNTPANGVPFCKRIKKFVDENWFCGDGDMIETNQESAEDVTGLYCDDITFCWGPCDKFKCPRNKYNIRDKRVPHSFFADGVVPDDCPKKQLV